MNRTVIIVALLGWAAVSALVIYTRSSPGSGDATVVVVTAAQRSADGDTRTPLATPPPRAVPSDGDKAALVRELQKELKRVGCYDGEVSGVWTTSSRRAMRTFTDRVNATLPIDDPDHILLNLVQGHRQKACGVACPAGQQDGPEGRCVPQAMAVQAAAKKPETPGDTTTVITGSAATAVAATAIGAAAMPRPDGPSTAAAKAAAAPSADSERPQRAARQSGPVPPDGMRERRRRDTAHRDRAHSRPPAAVRSFVKSVQRALKSLGIH